MVLDVVNFTKQYPLSFGYALGLSLSPLESRLNFCNHRFKHAHHKFFSSSKVEMAEIKCKYIEHLPKVVFEFLSCNYKILPLHNSIFPKIKCIEQRIYGTNSIF